MYVCMCTCVCMGTGTHAHVNTCVWRPECHSQKPSILFSETGSTPDLLGLARLAGKHRDPPLSIPSPQPWNYKPAPPCPAFYLGDSLNSGLHTCMPQALATVLSPQPPQFPPQFLEFMCQCSGAYILTTITRGFRTLYNQRWNGDRMPGEEVFVAVHITLRHSVSLQLWPHRPTGALWPVCAVTLHTAKQGCRTP